jgi:hypothetical protein
MVDSAITWLFVGECFDLDDNESSLYQGSELSRELPVGRLRAAPNIF